MENYGLAADYYSKADMPAEEAEMLATRRARKEGIILHRNRIVRRESCHDLLDAPAKTAREACADCCRRVMGSKIS